jgi:hypothetical protein
MNERKKANIFETVDNSNYMVKNINNYNPDENDNDIFIPRFEDVIYTEHIINISNDKPNKVKLFFINIKNKFNNFISSISKCK